jgi:hypothetical protein
MKYDLDLEGFKPFEFLENHIIVSKIATIKKLDEDEIKRRIDGLKEHFYYLRHIKIDSKNTDKIVFVLNRRQDQLCVGFIDDKIEVGFNCREYTEADRELDERYKEIEKKIKHLEMPSLV